MAEQSRKPESLAHHTCPDSPAKRAPDSNSRHRPSAALQVLLRDLEVSSVKVVPPQGPEHFGGAIGPPREEAKPRQQGTPSSQAGASRQTERHELLHISFLHLPPILSSFPLSLYSCRATSNSVLFPSAPPPWWYDLALNCMHDMCTVLLHTYIRANSMHQTHDHCMSSDLIQFHHDVGVWSRPYLCHLSTVAIHNTSDRKYEPDCFRSPLGRSIEEGGPCIMKKTPRSRLRCTT